MKSEKYVFLEEYIQLMWTWHSFVGVDDLGVSDVDVAKFPLIEAGCRVQ